MCAKSEKELKTLIQAERIYNQNTGMEFSIEKCAMLISGKQQMMEGTKQPNQEKIWTLREQEICISLWILEVDNIKLAEMKEKTKKKYLRRMRKLLKTNYISKISSKG